jgi:hypothetical protein
MEDRAAKERCGQWQQLKHRWRFPWEACARWPWEWDIVVTAHLKSTDTFKRLCDSGSVLQCQSCSVDGLRRFGWGRLLSATKSILDHRLATPVGLWERISTDVHNCAISSSQARLNFLFSST